MSEITPTGSLDKQRLRQTWLERLESGAYPQGYNYLATVDRKTGVWSYCCLGVACEVYIELVGPLEIERYDTERCYAGREDLLPAVVVEAFGFRSPRGDARLDSPRRRYTSLQDANDSSVSFPEIAALVRRHYREVFVD
jgi:hypothetical protein